MREKPPNALPFFGFREQDAARGVAISPGTPRLLIVALDRLGNAPVHHEADVRFVDSHPKRYESESQRAAVKVRPGDRQTDSFRLGHEPTLVYACVY